MAASRQGPFILRSGHRPDPALRYRRVRTNGILH